MAEMDVDIEMEDDEVEFYNGESFTFLFVSMGMGDCMIARCPDGKVIIYDCGSKGQLDAQFLDFQQARELLRTDEWAGGQDNTVHALVLSHPDRDHYNQIWQLLNESVDGSLPRISVTWVYYSGNWNDYSENGIDGYFVVTNPATFLVRVALGSHTDDENQTFTRDVEDNEVTTDEILDKYEIIHGGTSDEGSNWGVRILASEVPRNPAIDPQTPDNNAGSVVVLFYFQSAAIGADRLLMLGDATFSTEVWLRNYHGDAIGEVEVSQIGHHGSSSTSSSQPFVNTVRPSQIAVVSVSYGEHTHFHPRLAALQRWFDVMAPNSTEDHWVDYWLTPQEAPATNHNAARPVDWSDPNDVVNFWLETWPDHVFHNGSQTYYYLNFVPEPGQLDDNLEPYETIWAVKNNGYLLKGDQIDRALFSTAHGSRYIQIP